MAQKEALLAKKQVESLLPDLIYYGYSTYCLTLVAYRALLAKKKALLAKKQVECLMQDIIYYGYST